MNDIGNVILTKFLMFADDIKVFGSVSLASDFERLQLSLTNIDAWCKENFMELNVLKCVVISYKRGAAPVQYDYVLNGSTLKRVDRVRDLGVTMTPSLNPHEHIAHITTKASSLLGFIFRSTRNFNSPFTLITLYKSLVRPLLEYGSIIWSPFQKNHVSQLESIQTRFIRMLGPRLGFTYRTTPVDDVEKSFDLLPLSLRRHHADIFMLYKLVNGFVDCPNILSGIDITTPRGTRSRTIFSRRFLPAYYSYNSGISRLPKAGSTAAA
ncbi:uncharacterized protein LOC129000724 [Macrosteles quadrilineatus]|uniref:uncharacterized protein LOC129000724 n=1 Tax=Macrosteles quadrilineatus TaxID=74068 RepID=UPI0023E19231|nr:uncharacterized protein LOC129000724 [Macrosteles quadrilineatus]